MKKSKTLTILTVSLIILIFSGGILGISLYAKNNFDDASDDNESSHIWGSVESYDGTEPMIRNMGELLDVSLTVRREQGEKPPLLTEPYGYWEGEIEATVNSAILYNDVDSTNLSEEDKTEVKKYNNYIEDGYQPLVINLTLHNINAESGYDGIDNAIYSDSFSFSTEEEFSKDKFLGNQTNGTWYLTGLYCLASATPHSEGNAYLFFSLKPDETTNLTLCYLVKADELPMDNLIFAIKTSNYTHAYGVRLDKIEGVK